MLVECLRVEGIPYVFGLPGDPRHLYDALSNAGDDGPKAIGVRYETSGAFMAMACARVSGTMAACFGCPGPGVANLVPGILEAYSGCTPMLVLGVRAPRQTNGMGAFLDHDRRVASRRCLPPAPTLRHRSSSAPVRATGAG